MFSYAIFTSALCLCCIATAHAQTAAPAVNPAPASSGAFTNYRAFNANDALQDWRAANDAVQQLGGHMGHVRNKTVAADTPRAAASRASAPNAPMREVKP